MTDNGFHFFIFQVAFKATIGGGIHGDIAVDDVTFTDGECPFSGKTFHLFTISYHPQLKLTIAKEQNAGMPKVRLFWLFPFFLGGV